MEMNNRDQQNNDVEYCDTYPTLLREELTLLNQFSPALTEIRTFLYNYFRREPGNLMIFPLGIELALMILYIGAREDTFKEICNVSKLPYIKEDGLKLIKATVGYCTKWKRNTINFQSKFITALNNDTDIGLVEKIYNLIQDLTICNENNFNGDSEFKIKQEFIDTISECFPKNCYTKKSWPENSQTFEITAVLPPTKTYREFMEPFQNSSPSESPRSFVNTAYFTANWNCLFRDCDEKSPHQFLKNGGPPVNAKSRCMHTESKFIPVSNPDLKATLVKIPYKDNGVSLILIIPEEDSSLEILEETIEGENTNLAEIAKIKKSESERIDLHLPQFKIEKELNVTPFFQEMGLKIFQEDFVKETPRRKRKPDFRDLTDTEIYFEKFVQREIVEVHKLGTNSPLLVGSHVELKNGTEKVVLKVVINRPFMFYVYDEVTEWVYLIGRVVDPEDNKAKNKDDEAGPSGTAEAGPSGTNVVDHSGADVADYSRTDLAGPSGTGVVAGHSRANVANFSRTDLAGPSGTGVVAGHSRANVANFSRTDLAGPSGTDEAGPSGTNVVGHSGTDVADYSRTDLAGPSGTGVVAGHSRTNVANFSRTDLAGPSGTDEAGHSRTNVAGLLGTGVKY